MGSLLRGACGKLLKCAGGALRMCKHTEPTPPVTYCQWVAHWNVACGTCYPSGSAHDPTVEFTADPAGSASTTTDVDSGKAQTIEWTDCDTATSWGDVYLSTECPDESDAPSPETMPSTCICHCNYEKGFPLHMVARSAAWTAPNCTGDRTIREAQSLAALYISTASGGCCEGAACDGDTPCHNELDGTSNAVCWRGPFCTMELAEDYYNSHWHDDAYWSC